MEIQLTNILFQIVNFGIVLGALVFLLYKPILKLFEERSKRIAEGQKAAEEAIKEKEKIAALEEKTKKQLEKRAAEVMEKAVSEAEAEKQRIIDEAQAQAQAEIEKAKAKWAEEKERLKESMMVEMAEAVVKVSEKVIGESLSAKKHQDLINKELTKILKEI